MSDSCDSSEDWCEPYGAPVSAGRYPVLVECERELLECTGSPVPVGARLADLSDEQLHRIAQEHLDTAINMRRWDSAVYGHVLDSSATGMIAFSEGRIALITALKGEAFVQAIATEVGAQELPPSVPYWRDMIAVARKRELTEDECAALGYPTGTEWTQVGEAELGQFVEYLCDRVGSCYFESEVCGQVGGTGWTNRRNFAKARLDAIEEHRGWEWLKPIKRRCFRRWERLIAKGRKEQEAEQRGERNDLDAVLKLAGFVAIPPSAPRTMHELLQFIKDEHVRSKGSHDA